MLPLLGKGHIMWIDNWYSSCCLFDYLHNWKTMACGTIRQIVSQVRSEMPTCRSTKSAHSALVRFCAWNTATRTRMLITQLNKSIVPAPKQQKLSSAIRATVCYGIQFQYGDCWQTGSNAATILKWEKDNEMEQKVDLPPPSHILAG